MITAPEQCEIDDEDIDGEIFSERDLVDADDFGITLPGGVDHEWLLGELWKDLLRGEHAKEVLAEAEMRRIIEVNRTMDHQFVEGLGQLRARVSLDTYLHWTSRYGPDFWKEEANLQYFAKRNPGFLVETTHKKSIHVVDGFRDSKVTAGASGGLVLPAGAWSAQPEVGASVNERGKPAAGGCEAPAAVQPRPRSSRGGRWAK